MKSLFLLRHAGSHNLHSGMGDLERALTDRGRREARLVGNYLNSKSLWPDLVLCSPAVRARETTEIILRPAGREIEVRADPRIYDATARTLLNVISETNVSRETLLLVGHNPGLEGLLRLLTGRSASMGTASLVQTSVAADEWSQCRAGTCTLDWIITTGELENDQSAE
jgi:phosphohistidine phosphatase